MERRWEEEGKRGVVVMVTPDVVMVTLIHTRARTCTFHQSGGYACGMAVPVHVHVGYTYSYAPGPYGLSELGHWSPRASAASACARLANYELRPARANPDRPRGAATTRGLVFLLPWLRCFVSPRGCTPWGPLSLAHVIGARHWRVWIDHSGCIEGGAVSPPIH